MKSGRGRRKDGVSEAGGGSLVDGRWTRSLKGWCVVTWGDGEEETVFGRDIEVRIYC